MSDIYVGLMSGTSMDGIDAVAVSFGDSSVEILGTYTEQYPDKLRDQLIAAVREPLDVELDTNGDLDRQVGECFGRAANAVIGQSGIRRKDIAAIGSHGQTLRHQPNAARPFSLQLGDPDIIAADTGCTTIADFRTADIEAGGQGAPLAPPFHQWLFSRPGQSRVVVNIGGIANVTVLPGDGTAVVGFDTGPGNGLMDRWVQKHKDQPYDDHGRWASGGMIIEKLLEGLLGDPYFAAPAPKSTGFEYFNLNWLDAHDTAQYDARNVQATLCELTAISIANAIRALAANRAETYICGGGVHNVLLLERLRANLSGARVTSTADVGLDPDWVEAVAFAWLAKRHLAGEPGNLPSVTGATHKVVLGKLHLPMQ